MFNHLIYTNMKKIAVSILIALSACSAMSSCTNAEASNVINGDSIEHTDMDTWISFCVVYKASAEYLGEWEGWYPSDFHAMIPMIREADLRDHSGDVIPEVPEYDDIKNIVWPNGYGKE